MSFSHTARNTSTNHGYLNDIHDHFKITITYITRRRTFLLSDLLE